MASVCSLVAAGAAVCALSPSDSSPIHTTTSTTSTGTIGLRSSSKQPTAVAGNSAAETTAAGEHGNRGDHQDSMAGHTFLPIPQREDDGESPTPVTPAVGGGGEEAAATVQDGNARAGNASGGIQTGESQGRRGGQSPPLPSRPQAKGRPYQNPAEAAAAAMTTTRRATMVEGGDDPQGQSDAEGSESTTSLAHELEATSVDGEGEGEGMCSPLEVVGLDDCPELIPDGEGGDVGSNAVINKMLEMKADMLRQVHNKRSNIDLYVNNHEAIGKRVYLLLVFQCCSLGR